MVLLVKMFCGASITQGCICQLSTGGGVDSLGETEGRQQMTRYLTPQLGGVIPICNHLYCVCTMSMAYM